MIQEIKHVLQLATTEEEGLQKMLLVVLECLRLQPDSRIRGPFIGHAP